MIGQGLSVRHEIYWYNSECGAPRACGHAALPSAKSRRAKKWDDAAQGPGLVFGHFFFEGLGQVSARIQ